MKRKAPEPNPTFGVAVPVLNASLSEIAEAGDRLQAQQAYTRFEVALDDFVSSARGAVEHAMTGFEIRFSEAVLKNNAGLDARLDEVLAKLSQAREKQKTLDQLSARLKAMNPDRLAAQLAGLEKRLDDAKATEAKLKQARGHISSATARPENKDPENTRPENKGPDNKGRGNSTADRGA